jgi:FtsH-binding integral membrane protein
VDLRRLKPIDWVTGLFGAALVGLLWTPWYKPSVNAWQALTVDDIILCLAGLLAIWVVVMTATHSTAAVPIASAVFATFAGLLAFILSAIRLIFPPDLGPGPTDRAVGVWLGTAAALGLFVSAAATMRDERRGAPGSFKVNATELPAPRVTEEGSGA